jgi:hypothetical protein
VLHPDLVSLIDLPPPDFLSCRAIEAEQQKLLAAGSARVGTAAASAGPRLPLAAGAAGSGAASSFDGELTKTRSPQTAGVDPLHAGSSTAI